MMKNLLVSAFLLGAGVASLADARLAAKRTERNLLDLNLDLAMSVPASILDGVSEIEYYKKKSSKTDKSNDVGEGVSAPSLFSFRFPARVVVKSLQRAHDRLSPSYLIVSSLQSYRRPS